MTKLGRFIGGAEQEDPLPFLGSQELNSSIHFRGTKVFPAIVNALLLLLLGGFNIPLRCPRNRSLQDSQCPVKPLAFEKASLAGPVP